MRVKGVSDAVVLGGDGKRCRVLNTKALGLSTESVSAAAFDTKTDTLFLSDEVSERSRLVATDASGSTVKWSTPAGTLNDCCGIAVLPTQGVVVASSKSRRLLQVYRISDGAFLAKVAAPKYVTYLAADPVAGKVYASTGVGCDEYIQASLGVKTVAAGSFVQRHSPVCLWHHAAVPLGHRPLHANQRSRPRSCRVGTGAAPHGCHAPRPRQALPPPGRGCRGHPGRQGHRPSGPYAGRLGVTWSRG